MKKPTPKHVFHLSRLLMFTLLAVALLVARSDSGNALFLTRNKDVLAYASNMTIADLLRSTNASRTANNEKPLTLNNQLNTSAQLKANDMVDKNYWSHVAPDGTQPWHWFDEAGYVYANAGENLAYGYSTGADVEAAWMNSPAHSANILGDYEEVGFGIASSANFQNGQYTVVVAHYGKPRAADTIAQASTASGTLSSATNQAGSDSSTSILSFLTNGYSPTVAIVSIGLVALAAAGFGLTHRAYLKHTLREGKQFAARHPLIDAAVLCTVVGLILTTNIGHLL